MLIDTDVLVDHLRGIGAATDLIGELHTVRASILSRVELRAGDRGHQPRVNLLMDEISWEPVTERIADRAGEFARAYSRSSPGISFVDYVVAATADVLSLELITRNVRDFPMFPDLRPAY